MYKGQVICLIIIMFIGVLQFFAVKKGTKQSKPSKWFSILLVMSFFQLIFDIGSVYTVNHLDTVSPILNRVVHIFYMGFMQLLFYLAYKYLEAVIEEEIGDRIVKWKYAEVPIILATLGVIFLPLVYIETPLGNYSYGPAAFTLYIGVAIYIILIVRNLKKYWSDIPVKQRTAMFIVILSEVCVAIYQIIIPTALITCMAIILLNLGIYLTTENPDAVLVELLAKETKRADVANQAKTDFLAKMSHEIRTPINAVLGMNEVILRESKEEHIRGYAKDVEGAANSLLSIINDILDITKIEAGKVEIIPVEYDFSSIVHDVSNMISFKARAKSLDFKLNIDENIPNGLLGDDVRIRQILVNILNNAVKYTHEGSVALNIRLLPCEEKDYVKLAFSVKDTGIGIKEEDIPKLYEPFERIEEKRNRGIEGTGLGMNITMQLLSLMGSSLKVESVYGEGSTFSFVLTQEVVDAAPIGDLEERIRTQAKEYTYQGTFTAPSASVLVVDDNATNLKVMVNLLKPTKIAIDVADGGYACLEMAQKKHYDLIFLDHMMPDLDGIETLQRMKEMCDSMCEGVPVIALTANAITGAKEMYLSKGFDAFLAKPIVPEKLEQMIVEMLPEDLVVFEMDEAVTSACGGDGDGSQVLRCEKRELPEVPEELLPTVEGVDWNYGLLHLKDAQLLKDTVIDFYRTIDSEADALEKWYGQIEVSEEALRQYRIKVHGMKSSAALIGAVPLSGVAKLLEYAARDKKMEVIHAVTSVFLEDWRSYKEKLSTCLPKEEKKNVEDVSVIMDLLDALGVAMDEMDIDASDEIMEEIRQYEYAEEVQQLVDELSTAVVNLDGERVSNFIGQISERI